MKKILFLLLVTISSYGQTLQNPTYGNTTTNTLKIKTPATSTTALEVGVLESDGFLNKMTPTNLPIPYVPLNYSVLTQTLGGHITGLDTKIGTIVATTAGISTRVWFTADPVTITAGTFYSTNATSKGSVASAIQNVVNNDNVKTYFAQDLIGIPFATATIFPVGVYAGNLSASTSPNSAQQRWTVELYKCNNAGTPIASGITGAPVGSLGVTVISILDSGLLTLVDGSVTNVPVSGNLASPLSVAIGERVRYHVSAEKVGTAGANITQSVYYGSSYNSYLDVPVPLNTTAVQNLSTVAGATTTDALNTLNTSKKYRFNHAFVQESKIRVASSNYIYSGSILTVGSGGTYATITAAFNAASSGDILQLANGVYNTASESGGYLLMNSTTKRVLIRGNSSDNSLVIIRQSAVATYGVRVRTSNELTFQNLTIEGNQNNSPLLMDMNSASAPVVVLFDNCVIKNTGTFGVTTVNIANTPVNSSRFEFRNCDIYQGSNSLATCLNQAPVSDANSVTYYLPILIVSCNIYGRITIDGATNLNIYGSSFLNNQSSIVLSIGADTSPPAYFNSHIDIRECSFTYDIGYTNHGVLLGRGTKDVYFINNSIFMKPDSDALSLGLVVKSIAANFGDVIIEGNYIESPRPLYLKGAQYTAISYNTTVSNWNTGTQGYGFELNNPLNSDGEISSIGNVVSYNNFTGNIGAIGLSHNGSTIAITSFNLCTFKNNKYNAPTGSNYLNDPVTFWDNKKSVTKQDSNSIIYYY